MAYSEGQFEEFARRLEKLLRDNKVPRSILLSGGGNDIAGTEFAILLNSAGSRLPAINQDIRRGVIDVRLRDAYATMIAGLTAICQRYLGRPIPIVMHGYDYPVPDGRGFLGVGLLPGPWLQPGFRQKGYEDRAENFRITKVLIDRFNRMLEELSGVPEFSHVRYLNLPERFAPTRPTRRLGERAAFDRSWVRSRNGQVREGDRIARLKCHHTPSSHE